VIPVVVLGLSACGPSGEAGDDSPTPQEVSFTYVRDEILLKSCGFSSCHGSESGGLTLTTDRAYEELLDEPSEEKPDMHRVVPGDPDNSYLIWKLEGAEGIVKDQMPPGGELPEEKIAAIRAWIAAGAKND
jgi:hypothetical protein